MSQIVIGKAGAANVAIDRKVLMTTRLLITSDSGGGKTWLLKRLIEQAFGQVGIIVIDPEGEFAPLRTKFDFFLVGKGGDTPADIRTAEKVARTLLTGRASAICDIYEMPASERHIWVQRFLDALLDAPKELRHPYFVIVDEAHMFCPESGKGESVASDAMRGLATRGRKRMLCGIYATQRLATLSKDLTGMCLNRLVGPTFESINQARGAMELGIPKPDQQEFFAKVKMLDPGYFYAIGRAISKDLQLVHVGPIETPHGQDALKYELKPPPPTEKVREWLVKLGDLPKQAEEEARTTADFKKQIRELRAQLKAQPVTKTLTDVNKTLHADAKAIERAVDKETAKLHAIFIRQLGDETTRSHRLWKTLRAIAELSSKASESEPIKTPLPKIPGGEIQGKERSLQSGAPRAAQVQPAERHRTPHPRPDIDQSRSIHTSNGDLSRPQLKILHALAEAEAIGLDSLGRPALAFFAGVSPASSGFEKNVSTLKTAGYVEYGPGSTVYFSEHGRQATPSADTLSTDEIFNRVTRLSSGPQGIILQRLRDVYPDSLDREQLADHAAVSPLSSGFEKNISTMSSRGLVTYPKPGHVRAADWLFID